MEGTIRQARASGLSVVAAGGNHPGAVDYPAAYAPVLAVGASDNAGVQCRFAASGPELDVFAPGCPQDVSLPDGSPAWASGSSEAAAFVAGVVTQMRSLNSAMGAEAAEEYVASSVRGDGAGLLLDVGAAFRAAGFGRELDMARASITPVPPSDSANATPESIGSDANSAVPAPGQGVLRHPVTADVPSLHRLPAPRVRSLRYQHGWLSLTFANKPVGAETRVDVFTRRKGRPFPSLARTVRTASDRLRTRVSGTLSAVSITYMDRTGRRAQSASLSLRP
jgi:hypothetical protein